jgi:hypothetical protein
MRASGWLVGGLLASSACVTPGGNTAARPVALHGTRIDCTPQPGVMGSDSAGWSVFVDFSTSTIVWFGLLSRNGSLDYPLNTSAPAEITESTIRWRRNGDWIGINRSEGTLYFPDGHGGAYTATCAPYQGPAPKKF